MIPPWKLGSKLFLSEFPSLYNIKMARFFLRFDLMSSGKKLKIIYPHNQKFMLQRAHDVLVMKTCYYLAKQGHQIYMLMGKTGDDRNILKYYGLDFHPNLHLVQLPILRKEGKIRISWHGVFNFFCNKAILRLKKEVDADLIYMTEIKLARFLLNRKSQIGLPFVYEIHGLYAPNYTQPDLVEKNIFRNCDALITTTKTLQKVTEDLYQPLPPSFKVPLATDLPDTIYPFKPPGPGEIWRMGYVGQLYPLQGVNLVIEALTLLPEWIVLDIIGGKESQIAYLREVARTHKVADRVTFHGFVPPSEVSSRAKKAHLFVIPSLPDRKMPYVAHTKVYEYLAMGRPVVAADLPSIKEEIEEGANGVLFKAGDVSSLADAIYRVVSNPVAAMLMAEKANEHARDFSWKCRAERLEACFRNVLER